MLNSPNLTSQHRKNADVRHQFFQWPDSKLKGLCHKFCLSRLSILSDRYLLWIFRLLSSLYLFQTFSYFNYTYTLVTYIFIHVIIIVHHPIPRHRLKFHRAQVNSFHDSSISGLCLLTSLGKCHNFNEHLCWCIIWYAFSRCTTSLAWHSTEQHSTAQFSRSVTWLKCAGEETSL